MQSQNKHTPYIIQSQNIFSYTKILHSYKNIDNSKPNSANFSDYHIVHLLLYMYVTNPMPRLVYVCTLYNTCTHNNNQSNCHKIQNKTLFVTFKLRGAHWPGRLADPEVGGSSPTRAKPCCVLEQGAFTPQK